MKYNYLTPEAIDAFVDAAFREDLGCGDYAGDHSSMSSVPADAQRRARLIVKEDCVLAGLALAERIFFKSDEALRLDWQAKDGDNASAGDIAFTVQGNARAILRAERLVLNCLQRMSAIATKVRKAVAMVEGTGVTILDTRKTTPNFRLPEKWAVKIGGAENHRFGLFDMIMLKDNHIDYAGGLRNAIESANAYRRQLGRPLNIEVETRSLAEVEEVIAIGNVDIIMLDNMDIPTMREAVQIIGGRYPTEASGGLTLADVAEVASCGVNFISMGALTHSIKSVDMSLKAF